MARVTISVVSSIRTMAGQAVTASPMPANCGSNSVCRAVAGGLAWRGAAHCTGGKGRNPGTRVCLLAHRCTRVTGVLRLSRSSLRTSGVEVEVTAGAVGECPL